MTTIGPRLDPADALPSPGTDEGWAGARTGSAAHHYPNAESYLTAYERGGQRRRRRLPARQPAHRVRSGPGLRPRGGTAGESLHDFAEQHTPEALARDRGEDPPDHDDGGAHPPAGVRPPRPARRGPPARLLLDRGLRPHLRADRATPASPAGSPASTTASGRSRTSPAPRTRPGEPLDGRRPHRHDGATTGTDHTLHWDLDRHGDGGSDHLPDPGESSIETEGGDGRDGPRRGPVRFPDTGLVSNGDQPIVVGERRVYPDPRYDIDPGQHEGPGRPPTTARSPPSSARAVPRPRPGATRRRQPPGPGRPSTSTPTATSGVGRARPRRVPPPGARGQVATCPRRCTSAAASGCPDDPGFDTGSGAGGGLRSGTGAPGRRLRQGGHQPTARRRDARVARAGVERSRCRWAGVGPPRADSHQSSGPARRWPRLGRSRRGRRGAPRRMTPTATAPPRPPTGARRRRRDPVPGRDPR